MPWLHVTTVMTGHVDSIAYTSRNAYAASGYRLSKSMQVIFSLILSNAVTVVQTMHGHVISSDCSLRVGDDGGTDFAFSVGKFLLPLHS